MKKFRVVAIDPQGNTVRPFIEGKDREEVVEKARAEGLIIMNIVEEFDLSLRQLFPFLGQRLTESERVYFADQMAVLLGANIDIDHALQVLIEQSGSDNLRKVVEQIREHVRNGESFARAVEQTGAFPKIFVSSIHIGESQGTLANSLQRLCNLLKKRQEINRKIRSAMSYPVIILLLTFIVLGIMNFYTLPVFVSQFQQMNLDPPLVTQLIIRLNEFIFGNWWKLLISAGIFGVVAYRFLKTENGKRWFDRFAMYVPIIGPIVHRAMLADFLESLASALRSGLGIVHALQVISSEHPNLVMRRYIDYLRAQVESGSPISQAMEPFTFFTPIVRHMTAVGEEAGKTEDMLVTVAEEYQKQLEQALQVLPDVLQTVLTAGLGIFIGVIYYALIMPYMQILNNL